MCVGRYVIRLCTCTEIQAKYTETSAKTGYNIGRSSTHWVCVWVPCTVHAESLFMNVADDFIQNSLSKASNRPGTVTHYNL